MATPKFVVNGTREEWLPSDLNSKKHAHPHMTIQACDRAKGGDSDRRRSQKPGATRHV
jgi:hypothetical protein